MAAGSYSLERPEWRAMAICGLGIVLLSIGLILISILASLEKIAAM